MCGRAAIAQNPNAIALIIGAPSMINHSNNYVPRYNVGPGYMVPIARQMNNNDNNNDSIVSVDDVSESKVNRYRKNVVIDYMRWGLIPSFSEHTSFNTTIVNARSETIAVKKSFKHLLNSKRCVICIDGFFEWQRKKNQFGNSIKTPYFVYSSKKGDVLRVAGLYELSKDPKSNDMIQTFTVLTVPPSQQIGWLHDRMPVILDEDGVDKWLDLNNSFESCVSLLKPYSGELKWHQVSDLVNKIQNDGKDIIEHADVIKKKSFQQGLGRFFNNSNTKKEKSPKKRPRIDVTTKSPKKKSPKKKKIQVKGQSNLSNFFKTNK